MQKVYPYFCVTRYIGVGDSGEDATVFFGIHGIDEAAAARPDQEDLIRAQEVLDHQNPLTLELLSLIHI